MNSDDPFGRRPTSIIEDFYRREKERSELLKRALGPTYSMHQIVGSLSPQLNMISDLRNSGAFGVAEQARRLGSEQSKSIDKLVSAQRLTGVAQSAAALSLFNAAQFGNNRNLSRSFDTGIFAAAKALQDNRAILTATMGALRLQDQWKALMGSLSPNLYALRATAESAIMHDTAALRATGAQFHTSTARMVAEQAVEAQKIAEAMANAESPEESAKLFVAFVTLLASIFGRFKENTVDELRSQGLLGLLLIALAIISLPQFQSNPVMSQDEQRAYSELQEKVDRIQVGLREIIEAEGALSEDYVSSLPRAEFIRKANIRAAPSQSSPRILRADAGTQIAILRIENHWNLVVFRDPLTDQISQGWVYESQIARIED
ncbi:MULTISPECIES: SH3 domain-containing protein [unclassified Novosphingobium]|uniref:SH3 domain-containing protein n=1 Tax=unclassified Novosphingobium TaxID=2644732 RepID=UPI0025F35472|nr:MULTISPECIES: SH3 domain-containing protein [unclassified Novosphingobium]HQV04119.1 SH3 domain-containing protein [Novosphingobium sp.]